MSCEFITNHFDTYLEIVICNCIGVCFEVCTSYHIYLVTHRLSTGHSNQLIRAATENYLKSKEELKNSQFSFLGSH